MTGEADLWKAGNSILDFGPEVVIQTEGENGSFIVTRKEQFHIPAFKVSVVDTTGAGDVFHGAFLVGLLKGWDIRQVVLFCSAVSAIKCKQLSGRRGIPDFKQTIQFLQSHGYPEFPVI